MERGTAREAGGGGGGGASRRWRGGTPPSIGSSADWHLPIPSRWGGSSSSRGVVGQLLLAELEPDQHLEAGARQRGADFGLGERVDRGLVAARLALAGNPL